MEHSLGLTTYLDTELTSTDLRNLKPLLWPCTHAKSLQSCLTLCDPMDSSPPGSSVHRIVQARILEWVAICVSNACMHAKSLQSCLTVRPNGQQPTRLLCPQDSPGKNTGVSCHFLLWWTGLRKTKLSTEKKTRKIQYRMLGLSSQWTGRMRG